MIAEGMKKTGHFPSATNCENRWKYLTSSFRKCEDNNNNRVAAILLRDVFSYKTAHLDGRFIMHAIRIIASILYQTFLFQTCE